MISRCSRPMTTRSKTPAPRECGPRPIASLISTISQQPATTQNNPGQSLEVIMRISTLTTAIITLALGCSTRAQTPILLPLTSTIPLPNAQGRFDHFSIDIQNKRLFAAALGNDSLEVIDLAQNKHLQSIPSLKKPTG